MIQIYILILLLVYGVMTASSLSYARYQEHQILGVTLSRIHAEHSEVERVKNSFRKACYLCLFLSIGCSLLLFMPAIRNYGDLVMFFMLGMNLCANGLVINHYQKKLLHIKEENKWIYPKKNIATVDLNVSRAKGKTRISPVWVWLLLLLSFIPMVVLLIHPDIQKAYPLGFSLIGPICQLFTVFQYYQMVNQPSRVLGEKTEINLLFAQEQERINSITGALISLSMFLFWILFNFFMIYTKNSILIIAPVISLIVVLLIIMHRQEDKTRKLEETFAGTSYDYDENIQEKKSTWRWGCYYNPDDPRIFVPKRIASMGFTINIGRPIGKILYSGTIVLVLVFILFALYGGVEDYTIGLESSEITIDAAMYDRSFEKEQIVSVSLINQLPGGTRTNGYGGVSKSFGYFTLDEYGKCMLYVYNNVDQYIVMELKEDDPGYVIVNDKTMEKTESLYQRISSWLSE